jgi:hypothetical protein
MKNSGPNIDMPGMVVVNVINSQVPEHAQPTDLPTIDKPITNNVTPVEGTK